MLHWFVLLFVGVSLLGEDGSLPSFSKDIQKFYESGVEEDRLDKGMGRVEKVRTETILSRFLPPPPAVILDVGGGMGVYSFPLAKQGYAVYLIDPVAHNIDKAKERGAQLKSAPLQGYIQGDARKLEMPDQFADVILFFGPLYHLDAQDRNVALKEAFRVLKPGGVILAVAISRLAPMVSFFKKGRHEDSDFLETVVQSLHQGRFQYRGGVFFSHYPRELHDELQTAGFQEIVLRAVEGMGSLLRKQFLNDDYMKDEALRRSLLSLIDQTEQERSILGISSHIMAIGRKAYSE